jgi:Holliday junction DNA helicase RuvA
MIVTLQGTLVHKSPTEVVVNVNGVGYGVNIPVSTYESLGDLNAPVSLFTYLHVREDALQLYGFATRAERDLFRLLISVTGIGPKMAQGILSGIPVNDLRNHIAQGNLGALTSIPGVGRKLSERLVLELREKIVKVEIGAVLSTPGSDQQAHIRSEAMLALTSLGYNRATAEKALRAAIQDSDGHDVSIEALIKAALRHATK